MTPYDPQILMQNPFLHKKWGGLQKNRALYFEKLLSYGQVWKKKSKNFQKIGSSDKSFDISVNF